MKGFMLLQTSQAVAEKSAEMLDKDPHGVIITLVSVTVVFAALVILYLAYTLIGRITSGKWNRHDIISPKSAKSGIKDQSGEVAAAIAMALDQDMNGETYAAIGMAMHLYLDDIVHDMESYIITIKRK